MKNLEPKGLWESFYALTQIPRPSGKKEEVAAFLVNYGKSLGLETLQDEIGNVLIRKPASPGMENRPGIILQGHMDMVPQKNSDRVFDFEKDPIEAYVEDNDAWVTANGTTLGADNGIGVATAMAILADKNVVHPPLEALFTVDEETGMYGAFDLKGGWLKGKYLLNLDSETEGELYVGCAGGVDTTATFEFEPVDTEEGDIAVRIDIKGCKGGHSGCDIHLQRANAIKLLFRVLKDAVTNCEARLATVEGGSLRNAIPREACAVVTIPAENYDDLTDLVAGYEDLFLSEYDGVEPDLKVTASEVECPKQEMPEDVQDFLIHAITLCPHGVYRMLPEMPGIVETSNNLAMIATKNNQVTAFCLTRSSVESRKEELQSIIQSAFSLAGANVEFSGSYPGWKPNFKSELLQTMKEVYTKEFGHDPKVVIIHAGLECGIIGRNYPEMQMISFGPTIEHPHSPDERVNIQTVQQFYQFVLAALKAL
ncbi:MAG: aminoacyl-histidine dipeptidase [Paludibacteraceae bacterium]|nr:aminoacyl-histidine dipeptidase [Paludibacteraceae bacterium]MBQ2608188.1 aminoacyl-histidine dipeptidase [Paludibacteraceae bacterium]